jgi:glycosyltransferase involved in cell wall biosynthesis
MSRPLKFLHLTTFYPPYSFGGDAMFIYRLAHALGDAGHEVDIIHCIDSYYLQHPAEPPITFPDHPSVTTHGLRSGFGFLSPLLTQQTGRPYLKRKHINQLFNSKQFDVVHFHNISLLGPEILAFEPRSGCVVKIYTTHEHWLICPMHVLWKFNSHPCEKPECLRCVILAKRPPQLWRYTGQLERASRYIDQFVSPSQFSAHMHSERGFSQPLVHLPDFIDRVDRDWKRAGPRPQEQAYFLFVGRLERIKGLHTLIRLWERVPDVDLLVAGTGTYEPELRKLAALNHRIRFLGPVSQNDLGALYFHALACIVPSITFETFGMVIIESFARKTPVIVRDLGALPELVNDSNGGFVYRTDEDLLVAIDRIAMAPSLRSELGENGYRCFIKRWSREAHMDLYFDLLRRVATTKFGYIPWERQQGSQVSAVARPLPPTDDFDHSGEKRLSI